MAFAGKTRLLQVCPPRQPVPTLQAVPASLICLAICCAVSAFQVIQKAGLRDKAELLKISKEENKSLEDRIAALDKARVISKSLNDQELENQRERLRTISGGTREITDDIIKRLETTGLTHGVRETIFQKRQYHAGATSRVPSPGFDRGCKSKRRLRSSISIQKKK